MDYSLPGSPVLEILQARILEWVVMPSSRGSSPLKDQTGVSCISCTAGRFFTTELSGKPHWLLRYYKSIFLMSINTYHRNQSLSFFSILQILIYSNQLCVDSEKLSLEVVVRHIWQVGDTQSWKKLSQSSHTISKIMTLEKTPSIGF